MFATLGGEHHFLRFECPAYKFDCRVDRLWPALPKLGRNLEVGVVAQQACACNEHR